MIVRSHNVEFGYELIATLPYAYWHFLNGTLERTESAVGSEPLYFFSPDHRIDPTPRDFERTRDAAMEIPNMWIHRPELDSAQWVPPPLAKHYAPNAITFDRPTVVVYNRYNMEWGLPPINYFDIPTLRSLFRLLLNKYDVVYFNVRGQESLEDNAHSMELGDFEMIHSEFPEVHVIHDIAQEYEISYNEAQLRVFAGCRKFITMNGGPSILASYFGGENIIYTRRCQELRPTVGSFHGWYHHFNPDAPSHIRLVRSYDELLNTVRSAWVDEEPLLNVLVRCHNRPRGLTRLLRSIADQWYSNVRVIASYDNDTTLKYLSGLPVTRVRVKPPVKHPKPDGDDHKAWLGANEYLNTLMGYVTSGHIMFMDDDDLFEPGAFDIIRKHIHPDKMLLWRVQGRNGEVVPDDTHLGTITAGQISGIGLCFHHSHKDKARWTPWRRGDYRFVRDLSQHIAPVYLDQVLTKMGERIDETPLHKVKEHIDALNERVRAKMERIATAKGAQ